MDLETVIRKCITKGSLNNKNIFDLLVDEIETYFNRQVNTVQELKDKYNKKLKGDIWEQFCKLYLKSCGEYKRVWLFRDLSETTKSNCGITGSTDNGIDIVCKDHSGNYYSVQCKYRSRGKRLDWKTLSTFIGSSERGKFKKFIIMTNGTGVSRKFNSSKRDKVIAKGTFKALKLEFWESMVGDAGRILEKKQKIPKTIEELREARLKYFT